MTSRRRHRQGFTLIELLVVISIIGILVGLLLPAITAAREAGRRAKCQSNMRNVVLAILNYVTTKNVLPPSGEFGEDNVTQGAAAAFAADPSKGAVISWMTAGGSTTTTPMYSWVVPILPYLDNAELFNQWTMFDTSGTYANGCVPYIDKNAFITGQASNNKIAETAIGVLICPDDNTIQTGQGNLSYVVNGGFSLYQAYPIGWVGSPTDGAGTVSAPLIWTNSPLGAAATMGITSKLGVMFPESTYTQGVNVRIPWNVRSSLTAIADGASNTILMSENTLTGAATSTPNAPTYPANWACPFPNFTSFIGASNVCGGKSYTFPTSVDCTAGQLSPIGDNDGLGWSLANKVGTYANVGGGQNFTIEGLYPFSNSAHPGGCNMGFCDGAVRFISNTIDGTVYAKIITPAGSKLPVATDSSGLNGLKQLPVNQDAFAQ